MGKVLILDDHPDLRQIISLQLEHIGFQPVVAADPKEGIRIACEERPNLILLDIMMPYMDGRDVARAIRSIPQTKYIPIVAITAFSRDLDLNTILNAGCDDYLLKPFTLQELKTKIKKFASSLRTVTQ